MTARQFRAWQAWLALEMESPSRTDHYLMQVAAEVRRGQVKNPRQVKLNDFRLRFVAPQDRGLRATGMSDEQALAAEKAMWFSAVGMGRKKRKPRP